jgi:hypothetical protein
MTRAWSVGAVGLFLLTVLMPLALLILGLFGWLD